MNIEDKMHGGMLYRPTDPELQEEQTRCLDRLYDFNQTRPTERDKRAALLKSMFAQIGEDCYIEPPLHANFGLTLVDDTHIYVGDFTMIGPNVVIATAGHPILPELREKAYQFNVPVHIGKNCWLGAGVIVLPGVTIGDDTVIGAGSVVTKDIPAHVVAVGNPCRVLREISDRDRDEAFRVRK